MYIGILNFALLILDSNTDFNINRRVLYICT